MNSKSKKKLDLNAPVETLNNPFAALGGLDLPSGPELLPEAGETAAKPSKKGRVVLRRETAQRGGKTVVVIHDFAPEIRAGEIEELSRLLRKKCGCGGSVQGREIEIQGDQPARIREILESEGFRVAGVR
jgi:translation initiation factor 1